MKVNFFHLTFIALILLSPLANAQAADNHGDAKATDEPNVPTSQFIRRAIITSAIDNREPVDNLNASQIDKRSYKVYFFTEVTGKANQKIIHKWTLNGNVQAEVPLNIGSDRWRTYSSKTLTPGLRGTWQVDVIDEQNRLLATQTFTY